MIQEWYAHLGGEPWCFSPEIIANLTDWQILELYIKPAQKRAEDEQRRIKGLPPEPSKNSPPQSQGAKPGSPQHRAQWEWGFREFTGRSAAAARAEYDRIMTHGRKKR